MPALQLELCVVHACVVEPESGEAAKVPALHATHCRSADAVQPTICSPSEQADVEHEPAQADAVEVPKLDTGWDDSNVPATQDVHERSAVVVAATLK